MKKISYDILLRQFIDGVKLTENIDYSDKKSVRQNNRGHDKYRDAAAKISKYFPEKIDDFSAMLTSDDSEIRICCAVCLIELINCSKEQADLARSVIIHHVQTTTDELQRTGFTMWLKSHTQ